MKKVRGMSDSLFVIGEEKFQVFSTRTRAMLDCGRLSNLGSSESGVFSWGRVIGDWLFVIGKKEESEAADYSPMTHDC
jgi:hypothetical protein